MSLMTALIRGGKGGGIAFGTRTRPLGGSVEPLSVVQVPSTYVGPSPPRGSFLCLIY